MKILVTGANGFVAGSVLAQAPADWEVHGVARSAAKGSSLSACRVVYHQADLMDRDGLEDLLESVRPDVLLHAAALANIDFCEANREAAFRMNVGVTEQLALYAADRGVKLVFCSTDSIFDGRKGSYTEDDVPQPLNVYAETKCRAEEIVLGASANHVVARLSLVMGWPVMGRGNSFVAEFLEKLGRGERVAFPENEVRTPIDVITLGAALVELATSSYGGVLHLAGNTAINRYQMARRIAARAGYSDDLLSPVDSNAMSGRAPRPNDASLDNSRARGLLTTELLNLEDGISKSFAAKGYWHEYLA